jgi:hypothetical protein
MRAQLLLPGSEAPSVTKAASDALTLQAQDIHGVTQSLRARTNGLTAEEVRRQGRRKAVCRTWLMRHTIFLFATADLVWMRPLLGPRPLAPATKRLQQLGVSEAEADRVLGLLRERLAEGPLLRAEAYEAFREWGIEPDESGESITRRYWLLGVGALRGVFVVRPALDRAQYLEPAPAEKPMPREKALGRLARRYLKAYGPATPEDFAYFFKATMADARLAWEHAGRTVEVETERGPMTALPGSLDLPPVDRPVVSLLGIWDHFLLGWRDRSLTMPETDEVHARQPSGHPTAFADGRAFGTWGIQRRKDSITVEVRPFERMPRGIKPELEAEVADLGRFFETEASLRIA